MSDAPSVTYRFTLGNDEAAGHIPVRFDQRAVFGKARPPVVVEIGGHVFRSTVAIMSGETFIPFRASHRAAAGVAPGDTVEVTLRLDTAPRIVEPPADLAAALDAAGVRTAWDGLSFSHQREHVEAIGSAKKADTRTRRIAAAVTMLARRS